MDLINQSDEEILKIANPIMDSLMDASTNNDYERHIRDFSDRIKENFKQEEFQRQCEDYRSKWGVFIARNFIGTTKHKNFINVYWKQQFSNTDDEFLAILTLSQKNNQYVVERAFVDLWQVES